MNTLELNRDIKRMAAALKQIEAKYSNDPASEYYDYIEGKFKPEFKRLYGADNEFKYMNAASIRIMLRLNVRHRVIPFHQFGLMIEI